MYFKKLFIFFIVILCAGCGSVEIESSTTSTPNFVTATLPATSAPQPTQTLLPPSLMPTNQPIEATTTTQVNVRAETNTASESFGVIAAFSKIQVLGQESSGNWFKIIYLESVGWARAEFVQVDSSVEIPVVEIESGNESVRSAVVISGINVRSGPGTEHDSIGVLTQKDVVVVTGKDSSGAWMQINFAGDTGWVASEFLQIQNIEEIPVIGVAENTQVAPVINETPIVLAQIALQDNDSLQSPLAKTSFTANEIFQVTGDVSSPQGDFEDWVEFSAFTADVLIETSCSNNSLQIEVWQAGNSLEHFQSPCNSKTFLNLLPNESYTLRIFQPVTNEASYTSYTLKIKVTR